MVALHVLTGSQAGTLHRPSRLPFTIGRATDCSVRLPDAGVWDQHFQVEVRPAAGVYLRLLPGAFGTVNGQPFDVARLRDGDLIEAGVVKIRFSLTEARQGSLLARELLTWLALAGLCAAQLALIYLLTR